MSNMEFATSEPVNGARIKVIGVGGGGNNAVDRMIEAGVDKAEFIAINTDAQQLAVVKAPTVIQIGEKLTGGLGAGAKPDIGREAAEESKDEIKAVMRDTEMVFITAGMGGGTGTGAAPVIAEAAKSAGVLTVAVVTKPFSFENRMKNAQAGIEELSKHVDAIVTIPNDSLMKMADKKVSIQESFKMADDVLRQGVQGIIEVIMQTGIINCDFADVKTIMKDSGVAHMGIGIGKGEEAAREAVQAAIDSPLLETSIDNAKNVLLNITGGEELSLVEVGEVSNVVRELVSEDAEIIVGTSCDTTLKDQIKVTIIATGLDSRKQPEQAKEQPQVIERVAPKYSEPKETVFAQPQHQVQEPMFVETRRQPTTQFSKPAVPEEENSVFSRTVRPEPKDSQTSDDVAVPTFRFFRKNNNG